MLRTLLLGNISSPLLQVSPLAAVRQAWGGELPEFGSAEEVEELMQVLVNGMWNRLTLHQNSRTPFRLPRFEVAPHRPALLGLARTRAEEVEGFLDGLFGGQDELSLPQKAHEAVQKLAELQQMFEGAAGLLVDPSQAAPEDQLRQPWPPPQPGGCRSGRRTTPRRAMPPTMRPATATMSQTSSSSRR
jgi:hypothetical protein